MAHTRLTVYAGSLPDPLLCMARLGCSRPCSYPVTTKVLSCHCPRRTRKDMTAQVVLQCLPAVSSETYEHTLILPGIVTFDLCALGLGNTLGIEDRPPASSYNRIIWAGKRGSLAIQRYTSGSRHRGKLQVGQSGSRGVRNSSWDALSWPCELGDLPRTCHSSSTTTNTSYFGSQ